MGRKDRRAKYMFQGSLEKFLTKKELWRKPIAKDGSCLFRAVAEQVFMTQERHSKVRLECAEHIRTHQDDFKEFMTVSVDEYLSHLTENVLWGGEVELVAVSKLYDRSIVVYNEQDDRVQEQLFLCPREEGVRVTEGLTTPILLAYSDGNHYDSVYARKRRDNMAFCQSIVFNMLYEKVFQENISRSCRHRLRCLNDSDIPKLAVSGTVSPDDKTLAYLKNRFPADVIVGLASTLYRNVAMDVHRREKEGLERRDRHVAASIQFQVGDRCVVQGPEGRTYNGEISGLDHAPGCHKVYVLECKEVWVVPYKSIRVISSHRGAGGKRVPVSSQSKPKDAVVYPLKYTAPDAMDEDQSYPPLPSNGLKANSSENRDTKRPGLPANRQPLAPPPPRVDKRVTSTTTSENRVKVSPKVTPSKAPPPEATFTQGSVAAGKGPRLPKIQPTPPSQDLVEKMAEMTSAIPVGQVVTSPTAKTPGLPKSPGSTPLAKTPSGPHGSLTSEDSSYPSSSDESSNGHQGATSIPNKANPLPSIFPTSFNLSPRLTNEAMDAAPQQNKLPYSDADLKQQREAAVMAGAWKSEKEGGEDFMRPGSGGGKASQTPPEDDWPKFDTIGAFPPQAQLQGNPHMTTQPLPPVISFPMFAPRFAASLTSVPMPLPLGSHSPVVISPPPFAKPEMRHKKLQTNIRVPRQEKEVQVEPVVNVCSTQTDPPPTAEDAKVQTDLAAVGHALIPVTELMPPKLQEEEEGASLLKFLADYTIQCLKAVEQYAPASTDTQCQEVLAAVEKFREDGIQKIVELQSWQEERMAAVEREKEQRESQYGRQQLDSAQQMFIKNLVSIPANPFFTAANVPQARLQVQAMPINITEQTDKPAQPPSQELPPALGLRQDNYPLPESRVGVDGGSVDDHSPPEDSTQSETVPQREHAMAPGVTPGLPHPLLGPHPHPHPQMPMMFPQQAPGVMMMPYPGYPFYPAALPMMPMPYMHPQFAPPHMIPASMVPPNAAQGPIEPGGVASEQPQLQQWRATSPNAEQPENQEGASQPDSTTSKHSQAVGRSEDLHVLEVASQASEPTSVHEEPTSVECVVVTGALEPTSTAPDGSSELVVPSASLEVEKGKGESEEGGEVETLSLETPGAAPHEETNVQTKPPERVPDRQPVSLQADNTAAPEISSAPPHPSGGKKWGQRSRGSGRNRQPKDPGLPCRGSRQSQQQSKQEDVPLAQTTHGAATPPTTAPSTQNPHAQASAVTQHAPPSTKSQHAPPSTQTQHVPATAQSKDAPPSTKSQHAPPSTQSKDVPPSTKSQHVPATQHIPGTTQSQHVPAKSKERSEGKPQTPSSSSSSHSRQTSKGASFQQPEKGGGDSRETRGSHGYQDRRPVRGRGAGKAQQSKPSSTGTRDNGPPSSQERVTVAPSYEEKGRDASSHSKGSTHTSSSSHASYRDRPSVTRSYQDKASTHQSSHEKGGSSAPPSHQQHDHGSRSYQRERERERERGRPHRRQDKPERVSGGKSTVATKRTMDPMFVDDSILAQGHCHPAENWSLFQTPYDSMEPSDLGDSPTTQDWPEWNADVHDTTLLLPSLNFSLSRDGHIPGLGNTSLCRVWQRDSERR